MTIKSAMTAAAPVALAIVAVGLGFYYLAPSVPLIKQAQDGLNGSTSTSSAGLFSWL